MKNSFVSAKDRGIGLVLAVGALVALVMVVGPVIVRQVSPEPPGVGDLAPTFSLATVPDGERLATAELPGLVLLLDFFETTCVGCIGGTPKLNRLHADLVDRGLLVVGVNREPGQEETVTRFIEERPVHYSVVIDPGHVSEAFGVHATPTVVLVGADGVIRARHVGPVTEKRLREEVEAALEAARPKLAVR